MKPLYLEITGFGPFIETQSIDFSVFAEKRLFLIHGATGAGKSSLFDAMCYALYGQTTGGRAAKQMRSHHLEDKQNGKIRFIFQVGDRCYQAERQLRLKRNGIDIDEKVNLCRGHWQNNSFTPSHDPITQISTFKQEIEAVLGFTVEQFRQLIILPQGQFQAFLIAEHTKKEEILRYLFQGQLYEKITTVLQQKTKQKKTAQEAKNEEIKLNLSIIGLSNINDIEAYTADLKQQSQSLQQQQQQLSDTTQTHRTALQLGQQQQQQRDEYAKADTAWQAHQRDKATIEQQEKTLNLANKAEKLRQPLSALQEQQTQCETLQNQAISLEKQTQYFTQEWTTARDCLERATIAHATNPATQADINQYTQQRSQWLALETAQQEAARLSQNNQAAEKDQHAAEKQHTAATLKTANSLKKQQATQQAATKLEVYQQQWENLKNQQAQYDDLRLSEQSLQRLNNTHIDIEKDFKQAFTAEQNKQNTYKQREHHWLNNQAAQLAKELQPQQPCPVCGSIEHPQPSVASGDWVDKTEVDAAHKSWQAADKLKTQARDALDNSGKKVAAQQGEVKGHQQRCAAFAVKNLAQDCQQAETQLKTAKQAQKQLGNLEAKINTAHAAEQQAKTQADNAHKQHVEIQAKLEAVQETLCRLKQDLPTDIISVAALDQDIEQLEKQIKHNEIALKQAQTTEQAAHGQVTELNAKMEAKKAELAQAGERWQQQQNDFTNSLQSSQLMDDKAVKAALLDETERDTLHNTINNWQNAALTLKADLNTTKAKINHDNIPDLITLKTDLDAAETAEKAQQKELNTVENKWELVDKKRVILSRLDKQEKILHAEYEECLHLSDLAHGKNDKKENFSTFVLSVFLDEVLSYANQRLRLLSQDRYELSRQTNTAGGGKKGLDLQVFDNHSGCCRPVNSLSGGESFFTALALALGLADVATANAGGLHLDAIFIDEGFGTLDSESLNLALETLMSLDGEHRLVGIISHVSELQEQIKTGIEVVKSRTGSHLKQTF